MYDILSVYLENGLRVVIHKIAYLKTVSCGIWVKQGSKHEGEENNGLSHLVEHLMINIDNTYNKKFQRLISEATLDGIIYNAGTTKETTFYYFTGLKKNLKKCIELLGSIVIENKTFPIDLVENEKKVVTIA